MTERRMTVCQACAAQFQGYGQKGICHPCRRKLPVFIPKHMLGDGVTRGYVFRANGAVRYDRSDTARLKGDSPPFVLPFDSREVFPTTKPAKRTPQERLDSLTRRIADCIEKLGGIPDSLLQEVRREQIAQGKTVLSVEQLRMLAGFYLTRAEADDEARQRKQVVRS